MTPKKKVEMQKKKAMAKEGMHMMPSGKMMKDKDMYEMMGEMKPSRKVAKKGKKK